MQVCISRRLPLDDILSHNIKKTTSSELCLPRYMYMYMYSTKFDQDKTRPNTIQIIPFGFYLAGQNPDLMMMEIHAGTTTTTTMERDNVCFCCYYQNHKNSRGRKNKKTFLAGFSKEMPTYPKVHTKCSAVSHSASQSASFSLSFFLCQMYLREDRNLFAPFYHHYQHRSINQAQREKERGGGRKEEERGGRSVTHLPTSLIWHISTT